MLYSNLKVIAVPVLATILQMAPLIIILQKYNFSYKIIFIPPCTPTHQQNNHVLAISQANKVYENMTLEHIAQH